MSVTVEHENHAISDARFLMPRRVTDGRIPVEDTAVRIVEELARVGWDVEGFDVRIGTWGGKAAEPVRAVFSVEFDSDLGRVKLDYYNVVRDGRGNVVDYSLQTVSVGGREYPFYSDGSGLGWRVLNTEDLRAVGLALERAVRSLEALPAAPGHDDVTTSGDANLRRLTSVTKVPAPEGFPKLYVRMGGNDAHRLCYPEPDARRYGLVPDRRLVPLGTRVDEGVDRRVYDGFIYASTDPEGAQHPSASAHLDAFFPAEVTLRYLNGLYVVDGDAFEAARDRWFNETGAERAADRDVHGWYGELAKTFVPYESYDGSYANPIYVINRELSCDEVRAIRGPISVVEADDGVRVFILDDQTKVEVNLMRDGRASGYAARQAIGMADRAAAVIGVPVVVSEGVRDMHEKEETDYENAFRDAMKL